MKTADDDKTIQGNSYQGRIEYGRGNSYQGYIEYGRVVIRCDCGARHLVIIGRDGCQVTVRAELLQQGRCAGCDDDR